MEYLGILGNKSCEGLAGLTGTKMSLYRNNKTGKVTAVLALSALLGLCVSPRMSAENMTVVPSEVAGKQAWVANKGLNWQTSLTDVEAQAKKEQKLVFWVHMLGTMEGAT